VITLIIVILTVLTSVAAFRRQELLYRFDLSPARIVHQRQYYRIFTHAFLHADYFHLGINMLVLYSFGTFIEQKFSALEAEGVIFSGPFFTSCSMQGASQWLHSLPSPAIETIKGTAPWEPRVLFLRWSLHTFSLLP
jgi:membrane associated rhomboid family serine protease